MIICIGLVVGEKVRNNYFKVGLIGFANGFVRMKREMLRLILSKRNEVVIY